MSGAAKSVRITGAVSALLKGVHRGAACTTHLSLTHLFEEVA